MRIACIIQARTNSTRLPDKINADIGGWPMIKHVTKRAEMIGLAVMVAMPEDFPQIDENDVLGRYYAAASGWDAVMRITGDCPLLDPDACREVSAKFQSGVFDYVANDLKPRTYPDGLGCEIFSYRLLRHAHFGATKSYDREHVTSWMRTFGAIDVGKVICPIPGYSDLKLSVDTQEELDFVRRIDAAKPNGYSLEATLEAIERVKAQDLVTGTVNRQSAAG
jgi:spore coat polysaccharide biosynthesis protein SpsF (cytidylyltransferase family)